MRCFFALIISFSACVASVAMAQEEGIEALELGPSGQAYLDQIRYGRIDSDAAYFDPTRPAPPMEIDVTPRSAQSDQQRTWGFSGNSQWVTGTIALIVIIIVGTFVYLSTNGAAVSFGKRVENAARGSRKTTSESEDFDNEDADLNTILSQKDRQVALVGLCQLVLTHCLNANGVLFKRSWTHREALRKLPRTYTHLQDLRALVLDSERVHFGGRLISEGDFAAHVSRIRPILRQVRK